MLSGCTIKSILQYYYKNVFYKNEFREVDGYLELDDGGFISFEQVEERIRDEENYFDPLYHLLEINVVENEGYYCNIVFFNQCNDAGYWKGFDVNGFDVNGFNENGYNKKGFTKYGFNKEGNNKKGYNIWGFNKNGYNKKGYNKKGYNMGGFNKKGYNIRGFNKWGYNKKGCHFTDFNVGGLDFDGPDGYEI